MVEVNILEKKRETETDLYSPSTQVRLLSNHLHELPLSSLQTTTVGPPLSPLILKD